MGRLEGFHLLCQRCRPGRHAGAPPIGDGGRGIALLATGLVTRSVAHCMRARSRRSPGSRHLARLQQGRREARHLVGEIAVGSHRRHLILPQVQELFGEVAEVNRWRLIGHGLHHKQSRVVFAMQLPHCQSRSKTCYAAYRPALWGGSPANELRQGRIEFDGCR